MNFSRSKVEVSSLLPHLAKVRRSTTKILVVSILPAYRHGKNDLWVFCRFCGFFHVHGNSDGLRVPHCGIRYAEENYPHEYYLKDTGKEITKEMQ